ncbi:PAS/PAC sensor hybrid histidine kinase [Exophiala viscosa]|uniref:PAS/PAC sensor hybrid histidine kinase n=1 Tax=Exophiala viscosa TaxID=2486360 RepID=A0AAN6I9D5_9EURO|nr:PAS/PAC sensor hybrid histidine kinase [Exophiala viscosa]
MLNHTDPLALRRIEPHWNYGLIAASIAVSLLGAFTSTQMMCQARTSRYFSGVLVWTLLGSLTFGFCSIWSLHFIAMLACELDVRIGLDVPLTIVSALLAVIFTFAALAADILRDRYMLYVKKGERKVRRERRREVTRNLGMNQDGHASTEALLETAPGEDEENALPPQHTDDVQGRRANNRRLIRDNSGLGLIEEHFGSSETTLRSEANGHIPFNLSQSFDAGGKRPAIYRDDSGVETVISVVDTDSFPRSSDDSDPSRRSSVHSDSSRLSLPAFMSFRVSALKPTTMANGLAGIAGLLYQGATIRNICKGFVWSLAITSMHYMGVLAMRIPDGHFTLEAPIVALSAVISWLVCTIGCILMPQIEVKLLQQVFFSVVAASGVAAMHFTGMWATTFWTRADESPSQDRGYPPDLPVAVTSIAILTCMLANGLLAQSATIARNKLAEIVQTRKKLWAAIAQKENAEAAAAARSEFIASASHEIRTPLHQLQGYSDLLARMELNDESRLLLLAIQEATKSLSMITSNVLDWSRLEKGEAVFRPTSLDLRKVCESIVNILPSKDDEAATELMIVVAPDVPQTVFLDETYLQRILMNLLTNALKFTQSGYVLLLIEYSEDNLVIIVKDSGYGIPESFLPHLFEPFKQAQTRGAERGTGLGLAIIRQLLDKISGTVSVESTCSKVDGGELEKSGSTFTVSIPMPDNSIAPQSKDSVQETRQVAVYQEAESRLSEGLKTAWKTFGFEVVLADPGQKVRKTWGLIWTDLEYLKNHPDLLERLLKVKNQLVLVPYDSQWLLDKTVGGAAPSHIIPIRRPILWHRMVETIVSVLQSGKSASVDRSVRFAEEVDIVESAPADTVENGTQKQTPEKKALSGTTILLVEDNKINQRLGVKMLQTLGYSVMTADDGQDAVEKLVEHDSKIDLILMDQSMPRKDGVTALKEIREMEQSGELSRARPLIMVTAVVGRDAASLCISSGADAFLPKPLSLSKLEATLNKFLG